MVSARAWRMAALGSLVLAAAAQAHAAVKGERVAMDFAGGQEPTYPPGSLNFQTNTFRDEPVVYRTVWRLDGKPTAAPVRILATDWAFVWINGRCVIDRARPRRRGEPARPAAAMPIEADLAQHLRAGENVIAISTRKDGLALAGWAEAGGKKIGLASRPDAWRVWKFAPLTILEKERFLNSASLEGIASAACKAGAGEGIECTEADGRRIVAADMRERIDRQLADLGYESQLLIERGVAIVDDRAILWGGAGAVAPAAIAAARRVREALSVLPEAGDAARALAAHLDAARRLIALGNRATACRLAWGHLLADEAAPAWLTSRPAKASEALAAGRAEAALDDLAALAADLPPVEARLAKLWGAPPNELDNAIANKAGWIDDPSLMDSVPSAWGVRLNPVQTSWLLDLAGKWRFRLDPKDAGLAERVHEFGYNIDNQWPELTVPGTWEKQGAAFQVNNPDAVGQSPYPGVNVRTDGPYNGFAWYRKKVLAPAEWAGYDLELYMGAVDDWDWAYWNGEQIGHTGAKSNPKDWWVANRRYRIPKEKVTFGGYNVIAVRVYDCGDGGGILGGIELRCPALKEAFESRPPAAREPTEVFSSVLSPAALLTVGEKELEVFGWDLRSSAGPEGLVLNLGGKAVWRSFAEPPKTGRKTQTVYDQAADGRLSANWLLLWARPGRADGELPVELVLTANPQRILIERGQMGTTRVVVEFVQPGAKLLALRPIRAGAAPAGPTDEPTLKVCRFWSSAALAMPVHYLELARPAAGRKDLLDVTDLYEYRVLADEWGTAAVKLAPLPPLACYGLSIKARGLASDAGELPLSLGEYGVLRAAVGTGAVRYTVPLDTLPRLAGFTSYCFGPDVGVPGNHKELEIIAWTGCNSYRPQSNDSGKRILDIIRWANERKMNLMPNIDNGLGARPEAVDHWVRVGQACRDLPLWAVAYDLINEPANMPPAPYNRQIRRIVDALRKVDPLHPVYVETPHSFASIDQFPNLAPLEDKAVVYTFHDYDYRLPERWPTLKADVRNLQHQWLAAFRYSLAHDAPICISEYGGFEQTPNSPWTNASTLVLMNDFFRVFDQFGFHHHYYSNRGVAQVRPDGSIRLSLVHEAYRRLFASDTFYRFREEWTAISRP